jgi:hypothetical protein
MATPKSKQPFGGKKAAPFVKGGGRNTASPRTAKGQSRSKPKKGS